MIDRSVPVQEEDGLARRMRLTLVCDRASIQGTLPNRTWRPLRESRAPDGWSRTDCESQQFRRARSEPTANQPGRTN
jgi:hypothetical protein